jgi:hypothetical protein
LTTAAPPRAADTRGATGPPEGVPVLAGNWGTPYAGRRRGRK